MKTEIIVLDKYDTIIKKGENEVKALFLLNEKKLKTMNIQMNQPKQYKQSEKGFQSSTKNNR